MKFFSNDAKETTEDQAHDDRDIAAPGSVEAEPAAVPVQRAGSPWNDAPGTDTDLDQDGRGRDDLTRDGFSRDELRPDDSEVRTDGDEAVRTDQDETATTHADAVDLPLDDDETRSRGDAVTGDQGFGDRTGTDQNLGTVEDRADVDQRDRDDRDGFGDRGVTDVQTYGSDGTVTSASSGSSVSSTSSVAEQPVAVDDAVKDEGDFDSPRAVEPVTGEPLDAANTTDPAATRVDDEEVTDTSADFEPVAAATSVDTTAGDNLDSDPAAADAGVVPVAVPADTGEMTPGSVAEPKIDRLFTDGDSFAERFRDIQLRFVDSPKDATAEAATLVGEAVDRLTSALKSQQEGLSSKSEDTEQLRVELRSYRDMLNRLTAL